MKISKFLLIAVFSLAAVSVLVSSCAKRSLPNPKYRGMAPRGPGK